MAFVSVIKRSTSNAAIKIRKLKNGSTGGLLTKSVGLRGCRIDIQIDENNKKIRLGKCADDNGVKVSSIGAFSMSRHVYNLLGKQAIALTEGVDGWWYGKYEKPETTELTKDEMEALDMMNKSTEAYK